MERNGTGKVPKAALDYLRAVREHQARTTRPAQDPDIALLLHMSVRNWQRRKHDLREGRWEDRDWLEVWPPPPDWHPSWEGMLPLQPELPEPDGLIHLVYDEVYDKDGNFVTRRLLPPFNHLAIVAMGIAVRVLADYLSDGRFDGVIRFCNLIARMPKLT